MIIQFNSIKFTISSLNLVKSNLWDFRIKVYLAYSVGLGKRLVWHVLELLGNGIGSPSCGVILDDGGIESSGHFRARPSTNGRIVLVFGRLRNVGRLFTLQWFYLGLLSSIHFREENLGLWSIDFQYFLVNAKHRYLFRFKNWKNNFSFSKKSSFFYYTYSVIELLNDYFSFR